MPAAATQDDVDRPRGTLHQDHDAVHWSRLAVIGADGHPVQVVHADARDRRDDEAIAAPTAQAAEREGREVLGSSGRRHLEVAVAKLGHENAHLAFLHPHHAPDVHSPQDRPGWGARGPLLFRELVLLPGVGECEEPVDGRLHEPDTGDAAPIADRACREEAVLVLGEEGLARDLDERVVHLKRGIFRHRVAISFHGEQDRAGDQDSVTIRFDSGAGAHCRGHAAAQRWPRRRRVHGAEVAAEVAS